MLGVLVNTAAIIAGSLLGMLLKKGMPEKVSGSVTTAVGLAVVYIGIDGMMSGENTLVLVISMVVGALVGSLLDLDKRLNSLAGAVERRFKGGEKKWDSRRICQCHASVLRRSDGNSWCSSVGIDRQS